MSKKYRVLAVDADPDSNLADALGIEGYRTIGQIRELFQHGRDEMRTINKESWIEGKIYGEVVFEVDDFDLLVMGRPEGEGCYCFVNNMLRAVLRKLMRHYDIVIVDCEAGLEHFSRKTIPEADTIIVVTDASRKGFKTAVRIRELVTELGIKAGIYLIANRIGEGDEGTVAELAGKENFKLLDTLPYDEDVAKADLEGLPVPLNSKVAKRIEKLAEVLICEAKS